MLDQGHDVGHLPEPRIDASRHRGRRSQGLVDADEIVVQEVNRERMAKILDLLGEGIRQARESALLHSDGQILAFDVAGRDVLADRLTVDSGLLGRFEPRGRVSLLAFGIGGRAVVLHKLGEVDFIGEGMFDRFQIHRVSVRRQLNAIGEPRRQVGHEVLGAFAVSRADLERGDQFCIGVQSNEGPGVAIAELPLELLGDVLLLGVGEAPDFIDLELLALQVLELFALVGEASRSGIDHQLENGPLGRVGEARGRANAVPLDKAVENLGAALGG